MRITKIENQKRRRGRKNLYADGQFVAGVSDETVFRLGLRTGDELSPAQLKVLQETEGLQSAKNTALRFLATRPRTEKELRLKLRLKEFTPAEIERTVEELRAAGLIDDRQFTRAYLHDALALRPAGALVLKRKLLLLGIDRRLIDEELAEALGPTQQAAIAASLAGEFLRKARKGRKRDSPEKVRAHLESFLARRGFSWETIRTTLRSTLGADERD